MGVHLISSYLVAFAGVAAGAIVGVTAAVVFRRLRAWDAWITIPLLLVAAGAHLALIPQVETERQVLFGLYGVALLGTVVFAFAGQGIWRVGAVVFPAGSIAGYFYFALPEHQADYVGLIVKLIELAAIAAAIVGALAFRQEYRRRRMAA